MKRQGLFLGVALTLFLTTLTADASTVYDMDGDGTLTTFDYILKKREFMEHPNDTTYEELLSLDNHLLGRNTLPLGINDWLIEPMHTVHTGTATYYYLGTKTSFFDLNHTHEKMPPYRCAINQKDFALPYAAGAYLRVTTTKGKSVDVYVVDVSGQKSGGIDLDSPAFQQLASLSTGTLKNVSWEIIPFPNDEGMYYKYTSGALQILFHTYPIYKLEVMNKNGVYQTVSRNRYGVFSMSSGGTKCFRITDIYGHVVTDTVTLTSGQTTVGSVNFPVS